MNNIVSIHEDIQEMELVGDQTWQTLFETIQESLKYNELLSNQGKPIKTVVDMTRMTSLDLGAEHMSKQGLSNLLYDKVALCGADAKNKETVLNILKAAVKDPEKAQYFETKEQALAWLQA